MNFDSGLTRRSLLRAGAGAGAAMVIGVRPWAAAAAAAAAPGYLTRSGYAGLEGTTFTVETEGGPVVLRLDAVADVAGAATRRSLAGSEDTFALTFSGSLADPLGSGIHTIRHPRLGSFELFASPVDDPDGSRLYEIVVDRSLPEQTARREAGTVTPPKPEPTAEPTPAASPEPTPAAPPPEPTRADAGRNARMRRLRRAARRRARLRRRRRLGLRR
jgi:hypothetical protein